MLHHALRDGEEPFFFFWFAGCCLSLACLLSLTSFSNLPTVEKKKKKKPPFRGDTERAIFRAIVYDEPEFKGAAWRHVSSAAKETIAAMLRKDPRKRPNAAELLQDFEWLEEPAVGKKKRRTSIDAVAGSVPAATAAAAASAASAAASAASSAPSAFPAPSALAALRLKSRSRPRPPLEKAEQQAPPPPPSPPLSASSSSSSLGELSTPLDPAVKDSLRRFVGTDKLRRQATLLVAGRLRGGAEQMAALRAACATLDAEGRGVISVEQLRDAITCVATHVGGDHGASCAVVEARRATESAGGAEAAKPATAAAAAAALSPSPPSSFPTNKLSRRSSSEGGEHEEEEETEDDDTSCGCSLSSSMCDLAAAEEREQLLRDQQQQQQAQQQAQGEQLRRQLDLLQLERHHLSSRPASAAVSEAFAGKPDHHHRGDCVGDQHRQQQQQQQQRRHHRHGLKHDCCSELGALLREVCDEFREGCRLDYNKFVDYALQSSARVK